jgi:putative SOS response-associated peptidase YedK
MCGRFNVISAPLTQFIMSILGDEIPHDEVLHDESLYREPHDIHVQSHFNIAPTEQVGVLRHADRWSLSPMRWWLVPHWVPEPSNRYSMFNAKAETLQTSRAYRDSFKSRRCVVPISGYFEWRTADGVKTPYYIEADADQGLALAGLWDRWQKGDRVIESCTIITAAAPPEMQAIHSRIPVHLAPEEIKPWLAPDTAPQSLLALLAPRLRVPLRVTPMSTYVNNARHKDPDGSEMAGPSRRIDRTD